jgi:hypothetical protein
MEQIILKEGMDRRLKALMPNSLGMDRLRMDSQFKEAYLLEVLNLWSLKEPT